VTTIDEIHNSQQKVFSGICRGGPLNGQTLRHPLNFFPMSVHGAVCGKYVYAFTGDWLWCEEPGLAKLKGGFLE
jgi:hypothetical protein